MSFGKKLLNATSKNYFSTIYFTSISLQFTWEPFLLFFNIIFQYVFFLPFNFFWTVPFNFFWTVPFNFFKEVPFNFLHFFQRNFIIFLSFIYLISISFNLYNLTNIFIHAVIYWYQIFLFSFFNLANTHTQISV